jgi:hypothetical protein
MGIVVHGHLQQQVLQEHATIVDEEGKQIEGTREKLEVCVMFFDKIYNCALVVKLFLQAKLKELIIKGVKQQQSFRSQQSNGRVAQVWRGGGFDVRPRVYTQDVAFKENAQGLEVSPICDPSQKRQSGQFG